MWLFAIAVFKLLTASSSHAVLALSKVMSYADPLAIWGVINWVDRAIGGL